MSQGITYQPLSEHVFEHIRELILSGSLQPGDRIKEREISEELNVSRVPVREALPMLESRGFIRILPRRGAVVNALTERDVIELFDVRESLEALAARTAARNATRASDPVVAARIERMTQTLRLAREAIHSDDDRLLARANVGFHAEIIELADNALLAGLFENILGRVEWLFRMTSDRDMATQCTEHEDIFRAIRSGQPEVAASLAFAHIASGRDASVSAAARGDVAP